MSSNYLFRLTNKNPRPGTCPSCGRKKKFSYYVSNATGEPVDGSCGRCSVCGYNYPPREFYADHKNTMSDTDRRALSQSLPTANDGREWVEPYDTISEEKVRQSHRHTGTLYNWLCHLFGKERTDKAWNKYQMGVTKDGRAIYWQKDQLGATQTGEFITYMSNGHRDPHTDERWAHNSFKDYHLKQCLFGLQFVGNDRRPLLLVEAPKTALIGFICYPQYTWVATGSRDQFKPDKLWAIRHHRVVALPDVDALDYW